MKRTIQVVLAVLLIFGTLLSACAPAATPEPILAPTEAVEAPDEAEPAAAVEPTEEPAAPPEPVTIKVMNFSQEQADFYKEAATEFQKEYPWITVQWDTIEQKAYNEGLPLMFQSGEAPDIFFWKSTKNPAMTMIELDNQGWIRPLAPDGMVSDEWKARFADGAFVEGINVKNGEVYSFPFNDNIIWGPGYMFYNKDVFTQAGLDPEKAPATWSELKETCMTIKEKTGIYCLAVPLKGTDLQRTWYPLAGSIMTDSFFDYKNGRFSIDNPNLLETFSFLQELYAADLVVPGVEDKTFSRQAMASGLAAIYFGGAWMPGVFNSMGFSDLNYGVAAPPRPDDGDFGALQQGGYSENKYWVSSATESPEAAWLFIEWMTRPEGYFVQEYLNRGYGTLAYTDNAKYISDPGMQEVIKKSDGLRVLYPEPLIACPALAQSKAYLDAEAHRKSWEWEAMVDALVSGKDFAPIAKEIADTKTQILVDTLAAEAASGLDVSIDCYTFSDWDYTESFDLSMYDK